VVKFYNDGVDRTVTFAYLICWWVSCFDFTWSFMCRHFSDTCDPLLSVCWQMRGFTRWWCPSACLLVCLSISRLKQLHN